jgi:hypothetical protein
MGFSSAHLRRSIMPYIMNSLAKPVTVKVFGNTLNLTLSKSKQSFQTISHCKLEERWWRRRISCIPEEAMEWDRSGEEFKALNFQKRP